MPEGFLSEDGPPLSILEVSRAIHSLEAVWTHCGAFADEVVSDTWAVAHVDLAGLVGGEVEVIAARVEFLPVAGGALTEVMGVPVPEEVRESWVFLPEVILAQLVPEFFIFEVRDALVGVLSSGFVVNTVHPALEAFVTVGHAWVVCNTDGTILVGKHLELGAWALKVSPAFWGWCVHEVEENIEVDLDIFKSLVLKENLILTNRLPSLIQIALLIHVLTVEGTSLNNTCLVCKIKAINLSAVVAREGNVAVLVFAASLAF